MFCQCCWRCCCYCSQNIRYGLVTRFARLLIRFDSIAHTYLFDQFYYIQDKNGAYLNRTPFVPFPPSSSAAAVASYSTRIFTHASRQIPFICIFNTEKCTFPIDFQFIFLIYFASFHPLQILNVQCFTQAYACIQVQKGKHYIQYTEREHSLKKMLNSFASAFSFSHVHFTDFVPFSSSARFSILRACAQLFF